VPLPTPAPLALLQLIAVEAGGVRQAQQMLDRVELLQVGGDGLKAEDRKGVSRGALSPQKRPSRVPPLGTGVAGAGFGSDGRSAADDEALEAAGVDLFADLLQVAQSHRVAGFGARDGAFQRCHLGLVLLGGGTGMVVVSFDPHVPKRDPHMPKWGPPVPK